MPVVILRAVRVSRLAARSPPAILVAFSRVIIFSVAIFSVAIRLWQAW
jgi:hypothetical protein